MDPRQISRLAKLLRENGDKVLNSEYKLTLTGALLRALNDSFSLIVDPNEVSQPQTFQVLKPNNAKSDVFRELQFIYDFVQKTQILCITTVPNDDPFDGIIDIQKFHNLRRLEIQRVPIEQIIGIQRLRAHLQEIICSKSVKCVEDIISHCGGDKSHGFVWNELKMADFSYNALKTIDCSLEFAPYLQQLNLSHNKLVSVDAIKWLPNLKRLNLSYNNLTHIPSLHGEASRRLQTLILTNNFIEDLSGISRLDALSDLNLSDNCIIDHSALLPLSSLIALQCLHLYGNPISCHPHHREETAKYLHKNTASVKFILDFHPLNKHEKSLTGHYQSYHAILTSRLSKSSQFKRTSGQSTPSTRQTSDNTPTSSIGSVRSIKIGETTPSNIDTTLNSDSLLNVSQTSQRKVKVRRAIIADVGDEENSDDCVSKEKRAKSSSSKTKDIIETLEGSKDHLETKKQIEDLRKEYGDSWLQSHGATKVQNVMGIQSSLPKVEGISCFKSPPETTEQLIENLFGENIGKISNNQTSTPVNNKNRMDTTAQSVTDLQSSNLSDYKSAQEISTEREDNNGNSTLDETFKSSVESDPLDEIYSKSTMDPDPVSDSEENESIYIVTVEPNQTDLLLVVSDQSIREKNSLTTRTITRWNMSMLESCERIKTDVLRLRFDTIKRDKRERIYNVEEGSGQKLEHFLRDILSKRPLSEMNQTIYRCVNCTTQFSREKLLRDHDVNCPECNSAFVVEIKEPSPPQALRNVHALEKSESHSSSIGSASSFNESHSKNSQSQSSFDSNQSLVGSTTNCDQANDIDLYYAARYGRNMDSDIEILSNPSISSIEVLDQFSRQSSRKQSEDRRYILNSGSHQQQYLLQLQRQMEGTNGQLSRTFDESTLRSTNLASDHSSDVEELSEALDSDVINRQTSTNDLDMFDAKNEDEHIEVTKNKKTVLTGMNLTESSSSGSVTDSICTAYEHQSTDVKGNSNDTALASAVIANTNIMTPIEEDKPVDQVSQKLSENKLLEATKQDEISSITTMLGGLFQSTNMLMSRNSKTSPPKDQPPCDDFKFSYTKFDNVDHRLKLYLYQNIFEDDNEHLKWLVKGRCYNDSTTNAEPDNTPKPAIFVMSTTKWYVLSITGPEADDVSKWIKRQHNGTIDRVEMVRVLPWKIGITFTIKFFGNIHFFLQDIMRTDSLLLFFADNPLPQYCTLEYQISERLSQKLLTITNNVQFKMLAILNECKITSDDINETLEYVTFITTETNLYVSTSKYGWLMEKSDQNVEIAQTQLMTNLVDVNNITETSFCINFLDEINDRTELWKCSFETKSCLDSTFNAIAQSWEKLFQVPLAN